MRLLLDAGRLLRSVLGVSGRYRLAGVVGLMLAVGWLVLGVSSGAYADECDPADTGATAAGCGTETKPYVVKPEGDAGLLVRPDGIFTVTPDGVVQVEVTNWPPASEPVSPSSSEVEMTNTQFAALLGGLGFLVALSSAQLFVQVGQHG